MVATAALEIAVKQQITHFVADARWLVEQTASPAVERILTDYLPTFDRKRWLDIPVDVMGTIKKLVFARNALVHRGAEPPELSSLEKMLVAVRNLLYALDYQRGHDWAQEWVDWESEAVISGPPIFLGEIPQVE